MVDISFTTDDGRRIIISLEEAKRFYEELHEAFGEKPIPAAPVYPPYYPPYPPAYGPPYYGDITSPVNPFKEYTTGDSPDFGTWKSIAAEDEFRTSGYHQVINDQVDHSLYDPAQKQE